jgi:hypothetical protein
MQPVGKYVVYDPPKPGLPYLAVLFIPSLRPRVFSFDTLKEAEEFLTANAIEQLDDRNRGSITARSGSS